MENIDDCVQFRNTESTLSNSTNNYVSFEIVGKVTSEGNIQSLLNYSSACNNYCYINLFSGCSSLLTAPMLSATSIGTASYHSMF